MMQGPCQERILCYGQEGAGKTRSYWTVAQKMRQTKTPGTVYVVDLDKGSERMGIGFPGWQDNMVIGQPSGYKELFSTMVDYRKKATIQDWLCVDGLGEGWNVSKEFFYDRAYGQDMVDWMLDNAMKD